MIDNFSWINTGGEEGGHYGFCHRRHAVMIYFFKGQVKSPIHHNTRDGSEFMFLTLGPKNKITCFTSFHSQNAHAAGGYLYLLFNLWLII